MLVIGDAAGMIDPMTGEGIHHAMEGGKIAAEFLGKAFEMGNFSKEVMKGYQDRWMRQFGNDYKWLVEFVGVGTDIV
jgi:flavin-dependent dehydrogenase